MAQNRTARREATREEFGKAVAKAWEQKHEGSTWAWKSQTIGNVARDWGRRTENGWRHEATEMSDVEIFEALGMDEELETEEQTTEISAEDIEQTVVEATETEMATEEQTQAQKWEQDPRAEVRDAWQKVWEHVRAGRIGGYTQEWVYTDDAWLLAANFADEVLGEMDEPTAEWEDLVDRCLAEIGRLL